MIPKVVVITGMHRSGTSLVTQWLYRCGLFIGEKLFPADVGNTDGHFEDVDFLELHQQFLVKRNHPSTGLTDKPIVPLTTAEKGQLKNLIETKNKGHYEWGWKEPRTCLFLDTYKELIPSAFYLIIIRDYQSTVSSLLTREYKVHMKKFSAKKGFSRIKWILYKRKSPEKIYSRHAESFLKIWIHYHEKIFSHVRSLPKNKYMFIRYAWLEQNDREVFRHLQKEWRLSLQHVPFAQVYKKELLSEVLDIEKYISSKELISRAVKIETAMQEFFID